MRPVTTLEKTFDSVINLTLFCNDNLGMNISDINIMGIVAKNVNAYSQNTQTKMSSKNSMVC